MATSGHSGVDRIMKNLLPEIAARGVYIDLLHINSHGPYIDVEHPNINVIELGSSHVYSSFIPLCRYLSGKNPDVLLSAKDKVNRVALWAKWYTKTSAKVVLRLGSPVSKNLENRSVFRRWMYYLSMRYWYKWASNIIVPSRGVATDLSEFSGLPLSSISVVPNPVISRNLQSLAAESIESSAMFSAKTPIILGIGELCERKNFRMLIDAFSIVRKNRPCKLVILGKGRQQSMLQKHIQSLELQDDVFLLGFRKNPYPYIRRSSVFALSSKFEGFGNVLVEALAMGVPAVSTDCPSGPDEIFQNGKYGSLVDVNDTAGLAQAIEDTLDDPMEAEFLKQAAEPYYVKNSANKYLTALGLGQYIT